MNDIFLSSQGRQYLLKKTWWENNWGFQESWETLNFVIHFSNYENEIWSDYLEQFGSVNILMSILKPCSLSLCIYYSFFILHAVLWGLYYSRFLPHFSRTDSVLIMRISVTRVSELNWIRLFMNQFDLLQSWAQMHRRVINLRFFIPFNV